MTEHHLIYTIIASIVAAFVFGVIAKKFRLPAIFGYLIAGIAIGPYTPGFVANVDLANQLAEIGIILLMFGVGLHFSYEDLLQVKKVALPGAFVQMLSATVIGTIVAMLLGYTMTQGIIFGFSLSVASTIVLLKSLEQLNLLNSLSGKIAIGWLIVEDIAMVLAIVLLPVLAEVHASGEKISMTLVFTEILAVLFKISGFFAFMLVFGRRFLPPLLTYVAKLRSYELNNLATLSIALGFAAIAYLVFDASLALGAFLAGMVLNESEIGYRSAENSLSMRETFSVLFFVSVGMLFNPSTLITDPIAVFLTCMIIIFAKSIAAFMITQFFQKSPYVSYPVAIGLAQIGEFSFILGSLALSKNLITQEMYNLILAGAILSIVVNPFLFNFYDKYFLKQVKTRVNS